MGSENTIFFKVEKEKNENFKQILKEVYDAMAKSDKGYDPIAFRYMCLGSHYRKQLMFTYDNLEQAQNTLNKLRNRINNISDEGELDSDKFKEYNNRFKDALSEDLNTSNALTVLYDLLKDDSVSNKTKLELISSFDKVLSLDLINNTEEEIDKDLVDYINSKIEERAEAKKNKDYALADSIRDELTSKGIRLIDTKEGTKYEVIKN